MTKSNDRIPETGYWQRNARDILSAIEAPSERKGRLPRYEKVDPMAYREPIVIKEKNAVNDPDSWLNRGLAQLGRNVVDAVFGEESGNPFVDYGVSNVPGIGAGAILAAGGMPGLVDAAGLGALRNGKKLIKPVKEFIMRIAGDEGLQAVDNYLTKFPKLEKLSMADADFLLSSGKLGKRYEVTYPGSERMLGDSESQLDMIKSHQDKLLKEYGHYDQNDPSRLLWIDDLGQEAIIWSEKVRELAEESVIAHKKGDIAEGVALYNAALQFMKALNEPTSVNMLRQLGPNKTKQYFVDQMRKYNKYDVANGRNDFQDPIAGQYILAQLSPIQDFDKIEAAQLRRDAQHAEKAAKKAAKKPEPVKEPEPSVIVPPPEPVAPVVQEIQEAPVVVPETPKGGPNKWRENGWVSSEHPLSNGLTYDELVGRNASEEDRRASFVLDSLMNEAVGKLYATGAKWGSDGKFYKKGNVPPGVKTVEPSYADYRHKGTNYDAVRLGLARDLERNAITGNMPVSSKVILEQAYNKRTGNRIPGAKVLRINGMDTYENLFRPRVKDKLAELEEYYNVEFMR